MIRNICQPFVDFYTECKNTFIFHNLTQFGNLERSIMKEGINVDMDNYDKMTEVYHSDLLKIAERLSGLLDGSDTSIKVDFDERNDWFLYCTNKRAQTLKERLGNLNDNSIHVKVDGKARYSFKKDDFTFKKEGWIINNDKV